MEVLAGHQAVGFSDGRIAHLHPQNAISADKRVIGLLRVPTRTRQEVTVVLGEALHQVAVVPVVAEGHQELLAVRALGPLRRCQLLNDL